jgi:uncharacterized membrane protein YkvA (DUF1232 family)
VNNRFFNIALSHASRIAGKPGRLLKLATQLIFRLDRTHLSGKLWRQRTLLLGRLVAAYAKGKYRAIPLKSFLSVIAVILYFLNPLDLVPDALVGIGLADDLAIVTWIFGILKDELKAFEQWESTSLSTESVQNN